MSRPRRPYLPAVAAVVSLLAVTPIGMMRADPQKKLSISGLITDPSGAPISGGEVYVYTSSNTRRPADFISSKTDNSGRYRLAIPPGKYWMVARVRRGERYGPLMPGDKHSGAPERIHITTGKELTRDFNVADLREAAGKMRKTPEDYVTIKGRILSAQGKPLAQRYVVAQKKKKPSGLPDFISGWTDADGRYTLYLPKGRYRLAAASMFPPPPGAVKMRAITIKNNMNNFDIEENGNASD